VVGRAYLSKNLLNLAIAMWQPHMVGITAMLGWNEVWVDETGMVVISKHWHSVDQWNWLVSVHDLGVLPLALVLSPRRCWTRTHAREVVEAHGLP
jgi:hypothetical protein